MQVYRPDQWRVLSFHGPDSQDFLQRITTANVRNLKPGQGTEACILNGQGRIEAVFTLWNTGPSEYLFEYDAGTDGAAHEALLHSLERYIFADKVSYEPVTGQDSLWIFEPETGLASSGEPLQDHRTVVLSTGVRLFHHGQLQYGKDWVTALGSKTELGRLGTSATTVSFATIEDWRVMALRPRAGAEINNSLNPLELGLVEWIAKAKGCFPGQEVVERISALGAPARRLVRLDVTVPGLQPGEILKAESGEEAGAVTSVGSSAALALVRKAFAEEGRKLIPANHPPVAVAISRVAPYV